MTDINSQALKLHKKFKGKLAVSSKVPLKMKEDLSRAYTPGVGAVCKAVAADIEKVYDYTIKGNTVAVVSDGSAVLGLGNIGAEGAIPVMEGKAIIFKQMADIDAFPICLNTKSAKEIIAAVRAVAPVFGAINLEDIKAPECFEVEESLQDLGIPVMHDDQHGTAIAVAAALLNAEKVSDKKLSKSKVVISGAGAAGTAVAYHLLNFGVKSENLLVCDSRGIIAKSRSDLKDNKIQLAAKTNAKNISGNLADALKGADIFIGVSAPGIVTKEMVKSMNLDPIIFALANPVPEIMPEIAAEAGADIIATGRSDFPNQINNAVVFPGVFRGALNARTTRITSEMKVAATKALAKAKENPRKDALLPNVLDKKVVEKIARAVARAY